LFTFLGIYKSKGRNKRGKVSKKKRKAQGRFKPFLLMDEEFCIQDKEVNNIYTQGKATLDFHNKNNL